MIILANLGIVSLTKLNIVHIRVYACINVFSNVLKVFYFSQNLRLFGGSYMSNLAHPITILKVG